MRKYLFPMQYPELRVARDYVLTKMPRLPRQRLFESSACFALLDARYVLRPPSASHHNHLYTSTIHYLEVPLTTLPRYLPYTGSKFPQPPRSICAKHLEGLARASGDATLEALNSLKLACKSVRDGPFVILRSLNDSFIFPLIGRRQVEAPPLNVMPWAWNEGWYRSPHLNRTCVFIGLWDLGLSDALPDEYSDQRPQSCCCQTTKISKFEAKSTCPATKTLANLAVMALLRITPGDVRTWHRLLSN